MVLSKRKLVEGIPFRCDWWSNLSTLNNVAAVIFKKYHVGKLKTHIVAGTITFDREVKSRLELHNLFNFLWPWKIKCPLPFFWKRSKSLNTEKYFTLYYYKYWCYKALKHYIWWRGEEQVSNTFVILLLNWTSLWNSSFWSTPPSRKSIHKLIPLKVTCKEMHYTNKIRPHINFRF